MQNNRRNELAKSVYSLAKYNNGFWKSARQAQYLMDRLKEEGGIIKAGAIYGNPYYNIAYWDGSGVLKITRQTNHNDEKITWERKDNSI